MKDTQVTQFKFFGRGSSVQVEQHPEQMCASGSIPLPTTKFIRFFSDNFIKRFGRH